MSPTAPLPFANPWQFWTDLQLGSFDAAVSAQQDFTEHMDRMLRAQGAGLEWMAQAWQAWFSLATAFNPLAGVRSD
jgi:hypothetical protein